MTCKHYLKGLLITCVFLCLSFYTKAQVQWAWVNGDTSANSMTSYSPSNYGSKGVASDYNQPPPKSDLSGSYITTTYDALGNFWIYGNQNNRNSRGHTEKLNDLWRYDIGTNKWTWLSGDSASKENNNFSGGRLARWGTRGIPAPQNMPASKVGACSWVDKNGNFWLFGGSTDYQIDTSIWGVDSRDEVRNDLWKYDVKTNMWTWMSGDSVLNVGNYGMKGVASKSYKPCARSGAAYWTDTEGNFWLYGGSGMDLQHNGLVLDDIWKYNPTSDEWTWVKGDAPSFDNNAIAGTPIYGKKGVPDNIQHPGPMTLGLFCKDANGNLLLLGCYGITSEGKKHFNDIWKYDVKTNQWTWLGGDARNLDFGGLVAAPQGVYSKNNFVPFKWSDGAAWCDKAGFIWYMDYTTFHIDYTTSLLWKYDPKQDMWAFVDGDLRNQTIILDGIKYYQPAYLQAPKYGQQNEPSCRNRLNPRVNSSAFTDNKGRFWLYGGVNGFHNLKYLNDLWYFTPTTLPSIPITPDSLSICIGDSATLKIDGGSTYQWYKDDTMIQGATAVTYNASKPGIYSADIITNEGYKVRALNKAIVSMKPSPVGTITPDKASICEGNPVNLTANGGVSYKWYYNGTVITGAIGSIYKATKPGTYTAEITSSAGCSIKITPNAVVSAGSCTTVDCSKPHIITTDSIVCPGTQIQMQARPALTYHWTPAGDFNDPMLQNPILTATGPKTYNLTTQTPSQNLVVNGDFDAGNTGFTTTYSSCNSADCLFPLANNGYSIGNDAAFFHSLFQGKDHTTGNGNFMIINGADPSLIVWKQTIAVKPNTEYAFGVWISTLIARNTAKIRFSINGVQLGPEFIAPQEVNKWQQVFTTWHSEENSTATIEIVDTYNESNGNDFGLDDVFFAELVSCTDSIKITTKPLPTINISASSLSVCRGTPITFTATLQDAGSAPVLQWMKNGVSVNVKGLTYTDSLIEDHDTITCLLTAAGLCSSDTPILSNRLGITVSSSLLPVVTIHASATEICPRIPVIFTASVANGGDAPVYQWRKNNKPVGSNTNTYLDSTLTEKDSVLCIVIASGACISTEPVASNSISIKVQTNLLPPVRLGNDTMVCNNQFLLNAHAGYLTYRWQDGSTDSIYKVVRTGTYSVEVKDGCGTVSRASVKVTLDATITLNLGPDLFKCREDSITIQAPPGFSEYQWSPQEYTKVIDPQHITVFAPASTTYTLRAQNQAGCVATSSVSVNVTPVPTIILPADTSICEGDSLVLNATAGFQTYMWNTGAATPSLIVKDVGVYSIRARYANGCYAVATFKLLERFDRPNPQLPKDSLLCVNGSKTLDPGAGYATYLWNTGSTSPQISVSTPGQYSVKVSDVHGCTASDTAFITTLIPAPAGFLPQDTAICRYGTLLIKPLQEFDTYRWNTGVQTPILNINEASIYWLVVRDQNGCIGSDTIRVQSKSCMEGLYMPNAFTPNGDGKNDVFKPVLFSTVESYHLTIYNRFGEKVFETTDPTKGWDGRYKSLENNTNTFVWTCTYQITGQPVKAEKGTVVLVR